MRGLVVLALVVGCASSEDPRTLVDVRRADLVVSVEVTGELAAVDSTDVKPPAMREMSNFKVSWLAPEGAELKAGEPLATFDPEELDRALERLQSDAAEAQKRLDKRRDEAVLARHEGELRLLEAEASAKKARLKSEVPGDLVASNELRTQQLDDELARMALEQTRTQIAYARSSDAADIHDLVDAREVALRQIEETKRSLTLLAVATPRAGTVVYPLDYQGDKRKVGDSVYQTDSVLQVVGLATMSGQGRVDEVDIGQIALHQAVVLRLDALPDLELHGTLATITDEVQPRSGVDPSKVARVEIALAPIRGAGLRPGMRFRGQIEVARIPAVIQVPAEAVFIAADGPVAYRDTGSGLERVRIVLGRRSTTMLQVVAGLVAGDRVASTPPKETP